MNFLRLWESYESPPASAQPNLTFGDEGDKQTLSEQD